MTGNDPARNDLITRRTMTRRSIMDRPFSKYMNRLFEWFCSTVPDREKERTRETCDRVKDRYVKEKEGTMASPEVLSCAIFYAVTRRRREKMEFFAYPMHVTCIAGKDRSRRDSIINGTWTTKRLTELAITDFSGIGIDTLRRCIKDVRRIIAFEA